MKHRPAATSARPFFLAGASGRLFALHVSGSGARAGEAVLLCPPFAEEMNKARRQCMLQARALAAAGRDVLVLDLYGTGESEGDFGDATWELWLDDIGRAVQWLMQNGAERLVLWGVRLGAALACGAAPRSALPVSTLLLWQPVLAGKPFVTQFLRLRLAGDLVRGGNGETTSELREILAAGKALEVAGYTLSPALWSALEALRAEGSATLPPVHWVEVVPSADRKLTPAARNQVDALREGGTPVKTHTIAGENFWSSAEIATVPAMFELTESILMLCAA